MVLSKKKGVWWLVNVFQSGQELIEAILGHEDESIIIKRLDKTFRIKREIIESIINFKGHHNVTPLMLASQENKKKLVEKLIELGANRNLININKRKAIHYTRQQNIKTILTSLVNTSYIEYLLTKYKNNNLFVEKLYTIYQILYMNSTKSVFYKLGVFNKIYYLLKDSFNDSEKSSIAEVHTKLMMATKNEMDKRKKTKCLRLTIISCK